MVEPSKVAIEGAFGSIGDSLRSQTTKRTPLSSFKFFGLLYLLWPLVDFVWSSTLYDFIHGIQFFVFPVCTPPEAHPKNLRGAVVWPYLVMPLLLDDCEHMNKKLNSGYKEGRQGFGTEKRQEEVGLLDRFVPLLRAVATLSVFSHAHCSRSLTVVPVTSLFIDSSHPLIG